MFISFNPNDFEKDVGRRKIIGFLHELEVKIRKLEHEIEKLQKEEKHLEKDVTDIFKTET